MRLTPAPAERSWMHGIVGGPGADQRFAYRCLPVMMANQSGWLVRNTHRLFVTWSGGPNVSDLQIIYQSGSAPYPAVSHFGYGILSWRIPYVFRTPPGYNLLVRGPSNLPKENVYALEGLVETDWADSTFTMNWQLTRPNIPVIFGIDEPICMLVPQRRGELERFRPEVREMTSNSELEAGYRLWRESRAEFLRDARQTDSTAAQRGWQRHYFSGTSVAGWQAVQHQRKMRLRTFDAHPEQAN